MNAVAPGVVWPRRGRLPGGEGRRRGAENVPLGRVAETADSAAALYSPGAPPSSYVAGQ